MKTAVYYNNHDVRIEEREKPSPGPGEITVRVMASGICGSDIMEWYRIKKAPLVPGHEIAGEVLETGKGVSRFKPGDRVVVNHHVPCNTCYYCLHDRHTACETLHTTNFFPGGFSEYVLVPEMNVDRGVFVLPDSISYEDGSFVEPLACVVRAQRMAKFKPGMTVLVLGSGIAGLLHIMLVKALGAGRIIATDVSEYRMNAASKAGAEHVISGSEAVPEKVKEVNGGRGADLVIVCTGVFSVFTQALKSVDRGGTVLFFAPTDPGKDLPVPVNEFWRNQITLLTSYANNALDAETAIELIRSGRVDVNRLITHRLPLEEAGKGFELVSSGKECLKVILFPNGESFL